MSSIANAKQAMGWVHQTARACCGNCQHLQPVSPKVTPSPHPSMICGKGGFYTTRFAICDQHWSMLLTGAPK